MAKRFELSDAQVRMLREEGLLERKLTRREERERRHLIREHLKAMAPPHTRATMMPLSELMRRAMALVPDEWQVIPLHAKTLRVSTVQALLDRGLINYRHRIVNRVQVREWRKRKTL